MAVNQKSEFRFTVKMPSPKSLELVLQMLEDIRGVLLRGALWGGLGEFADSASITLPVTDVPG